jgi:hypothetical protein
MVLKKSRKGKILKYISRKNNNLFYKFDKIELTSTFRDICIIFTASIFYEKYHISVNNEKTHSIKTNY